MFSDNIVGTCDGGGTGVNGGEYFVYTMTGKSFTGTTAPAPPPPPPPTPPATPPAPVVSLAVVADPTLDAPSFEKALQQKQPEQDGRKRTAKLENEECEYALALDIGYRHGKKPIGKQPRQGNKEQIEEQK